jgi:hypothetical protein
MSTKKINIGDLVTFETVYMSNRDGGGLKTGELIAKVKEILVFYDEEIELLKCVIKLEPISTPLDYKYDKQDFTWEL